MADTFIAVPLQIDEKTKNVVCAHHSLINCDKCNLDFTALNIIHKHFQQLPNDQTIPPPPTKPPPLSRGQQIAKLKDSGNNSYRVDKYEDADKYYSLAVDMSLGRPPWDPAAVVREEVVIVLCNRAVARYEDGEFGGALADAEACIGIKRQWVNGYYWKSKALQGMGLLEEALETVKTGLIYDRNDHESNLLVKLLEMEIKAEKA